MSVQSLFAARAAHATLLRAEEGDLTRADLERLADGWQQRFERLPESPVASWLDNGATWVAVDLALRRLGRVHVPLPPYFSPAQAAHALDAAGVGALVSAIRQPVPAGFRPAAVQGSAVVLVRPPPAVALPAGTAVVTFTSGTTGRAKGVCLSEAHLLQVATSLHEATASVAPQRHLCALPMATLLEQVGGIYGGLLAGAELCVPGLEALGYSGAAGLDPARLAACLARHRPDSLVLVPQLLDALVSLVEAGAVDPSALRFVAVGGARVGERLLARAAAAGLPVCEGYGLTECGSVVCLNRPGEQRPGSVGRALSHCSVSVVDDELVVHGPCLLGYAGEACAQPAPTHWRTGDLARIDADGYVHLEGRLSDRFVTAYGRNVAPDWVEAELLAEPEIRQALVWGEALPVNLAIVVADPATSQQRLDAALARANARLPDYARVSVLLRGREAFTAANGQLTANGRLRRLAILQDYASAIDAAVDAVVDAAAAGSIAAPADAGAG